MNSQSLNSISFVISAVYTVTFANSIYLMTVEDSTQPFSLNNMIWCGERILCGIISLTMTLRFFFGNNQYIANIMIDNTKSPWVKFYHFIFIAIQSVILLICSYSIPDHIKFIYGITGLFSVEVIWYILTFLLDKASIVLENKIEKKAFFIAEMTNLGFVIGIIIDTVLFDKMNELWLWTAFVLFMVNTVIDAKKNISTYMS